MMGSSRRAQVADQITGAVKQAGGVVTLALVLSGAALLIAAVALVLAGRRAAAA